MSVFGKIVGFFKGTAVKVAGVFARLVGSDAAQQFAEAALALLKTETGKLVLSFVTLVESADPTTSGPEKRAAAVAGIKAELSRQGKEVPNSILHLLIETAVNAMKGRLIVLK